MISYLLIEEEPWPPIAAADRTSDEDLASIKAVLDTLIAMHSLPGGKDQSMDEVPFVSISPIFPVKGLRIWLTPFDGSNGLLESMRPQYVSVVASLLLDICASKTGLALVQSILSSHKLKIGPNVFENAYGLDEIVEGFFPTAAPVVEALKLLFSTSGSGKKTFEPLHMVVLEPGETFGTYWYFTEQSLIRKGSFEVTEGAGAGDPFALMNGQIIDTREIQVRFDQIEYEFRERSRSVQTTIRRKSLLAFLCQLCVSGIGQLTHQNLLLNTTKLTVPPAVEAILSTIVPSQLNSPSLAQFVVASLKDRTISDFVDSGDAEKVILTTLSAAQQDLLLSFAGSASVEVRAAWHSVPVEGSLPLVSPPGSVPKNVSSQGIAEFELPECVSACPPSSSAFHELLHAWINLSCTADYALLIALLSPSA